MGWLALAHALLMALYLGTLIQEVERNYLAGLGEATWTTIRIATLG